MHQTLSREQLIRLVRRIMVGSGTEEEIDGMVNTLQANVPHPAVTDLIFWYKGKEPTAEEIVDQALAYQPIILLPPEQA